MATYKTPNVYVEEISLLPPSVAEVATAIPAFIGYTEKALDGDVDVTNKAVKVNTLLEYETIFGGPSKIEFDVTTNVSNLNDPNVQITGITQSDFKYMMHYALRMFFDNGGGHCYIISVGNYQSTINVNDFKTGLAALELEDEPTLIVAPDATNLAAADYASYADAVLLQCERLKDRFAIFDVINKDSSVNGDIDDDADNFRSASVGSNNLKYGSAYYPNIKTVLTFAYNEADVTINGTTALSSISEKSATPSTAVYNRIKTELGAIRVILPPSSAVAGVFAAVDNQRGVWKAPANVSLASVIGPTIKINDDAQEDLNVDVIAGKSINAIRSFVGKGTLIWGARTLAGNDNEWRYVPVRRLFIFIEESLKKATNFAVFEPNTALTWLKLSTMIESFLTSLWEQGALAGAKPEQAFFVNVGLGKSMTPQDILEGRLIIEIGLAAVRPAEFIVLRFSHKLQEA